jgi:hypothetical protein
MDRECGRQPIHLALQGCFKATDPDLTDVLRKVHEKRPSLFQNASALDSSDSDEVFNNSDSQGVSLDKKHIAAAAQLRIPGKKLGYARQLAVGHVLE